MKSANDYSNLLGLLENQNWPQIYMFKFILPFEAKKLNQLKTIFDDTAEFKHRESSQSTFISISAKQNMASAEAVISIYKKAANIDDIILL